MMSLDTFYQDVGVRPCGADNPIIAIASGVDQYGYYGYIKFQSDAEYDQADQFECWLKAQGYTYHRGYPDLPSVRDRRFFLSKEAALEIERLCDRHDVDSD
jgi:hypothetical protein